MSHWLGVVAFACSVGCTSRARVDVTAFVPDLPIVFADTDGQSRSTRTDSSGHASGELEEGGSVWLVDDRQPSTVHIAAYADVHLGATLVFGKPPSIAGPIAVPVSASLPDGTDTLVFASHCGVWDSATRSMMFQETCSGPRDLLATAYLHGSPEARAYAYLPDLADTRPIAIPDSAWKPTEALVFQFGLGTDESVTSVDVTDEFGTVSPPSNFPITASPLHVTVSTQRGYYRLASYQHVKLRLPPIAAQQVELLAHEGPSVSQDPTLWSLAKGEAIGPFQAQLTEYTWALPSVNVDLRLMTSPTRFGTVVARSLPEGLARYAPDHPLEIVEACLIRYERAESYDDVLDFADGPDGFTEEAGAVGVSNDLF